MFDTSDDWKILVNTYKYYKDLYISKYGEPAVSIEEKPDENESNVTIMSKLSQGTLTYGCAWEAPEGSIELTIEKARALDGFVLIKYRDAINVQSKIQNDLDDI